MNLKNFLIALGAVAVVGGGVASKEVPHCAHQVQFKGETLCLSEQSYQELKVFVEDNGICIFQ